MPISNQKENFHRVATSGTAGTITGLTKYFREKNPDVKIVAVLKNLPEEELKPVMRVRTFLDYCAAAVWVLKGDFAKSDSAQVCIGRIVDDFSILRQKVTG